MKRQRELPLGDGLWAVFHKDLLRVRSTDGVFWFTPSSFYRLLEFVCDKSIRGLEAELDDAEKTTLN